MSRKLDASGRPMWRKSKGSRIVGTKLFIVFHTCSLTKKFNESNCVYCGKTLNFNNFQIDHVIPQILFDNGSVKNENGFMDSFDNIIGCCATCNQAKSNKAIGDFTSKKVVKYVAKLQKQMKATDYKAKEIVAGCRELASSNVNRKFARVMFSGLYRDKFAVYLSGNENGLR